MRKWLLAVAAVALSACASLSARIGPETVKTPDVGVVKQWICEGAIDRAVLYLALPEYSWLGQGGRERFLTGALAERAAGKCKCPTKSTCELKPLKLPALDEPVQ